MAFCGAARERRLCVHASVVTHRPRSDPGYLFDRPTDLHLPRPPAPIQCIPGPLSFDLVRDRMATTENPLCGYKKFGLNDNQPKCSKQ
jgi:hypothetical protein